MQQAIKILLFSLSIFVLLNDHLAADPIADRTARYQCIYYNGTANITILTLDFNTIHLKRGNQQISDKFDLQNKTEFERTTGKCTLANETNQHFSLELNDQDHLQFDFEGNSSSYHLEKIIYTRLENDTRKVNYGLNKPDLRFAGNALKTESQGYKCGKLSLTLADEQNSNQAEVKLGDFMFFAFENDIETSKITRIECRQTAGSSIIPMVVGGGLLAFAAVVVIAYFIMRKKETIWPDNDKARSP